MQTDQHPLRSGFGAQSTADEVLHWIRLEGKIAVITGGYSGLGLETTEALAGAGAKVIVLARRKSIAQQALQQVPNVEILEGDLANLDSLRTAAETFLASGRHLDLLINNAGSWLARKPALGQDGKRNSRSTILAILL